MSQESKIKPNDTEVVAQPDVLGVSTPRKDRADATFRESLVDLVKMFLIALAIIIPLRYLVFSPFIIKGESMEPNFRDGEYLIIDEFSYFFHEPKRGDVIVFKYPKDTSQYYIKRIVALPGETIQINDGALRIENSKHEEGVSVDEVTYLDKDIQTFGDMSVALAEDEYFVLGDNRSASSDSRSWGVLNKKFIIGKSWIRALPFDRWSLFGTPSYPSLAN